MIHIYTDASSKDTTMYPNGVKRTTKVGVIVKDSNIIDIYYNSKKKFIDANFAEKQAILESIDYVNKKYNSNNIIVYTDSVYAKTQIKNNILIKLVKAHRPYRKRLKYKFNCLADWISRNGINSWRDYYYRHLLK